jgi:PAS domain-containing protein
LKREAANTNEKAVFDILKATVRRGFFALRPRAAKACKLNGQRALYTKGAGMTSIEPSSQVTFLTDDEGKVVTWNPACAALFGWTPEAAPGHALAELVVGDAHWPALAAAGGGRVRMRFAGGRDGPATLSLLRQYGAGGAPQGWSASVTIAPAESHIESERVGNTPLSAVVDLLPGTFYALNREGRVVVSNHPHARLTDLPRADRGA